MRIRKGQRYRALEDLSVKFLTHWKAPFTGGGRAMMPAGTAFTVVADPPWFTFSVRCVPDDFPEPPGDAGLTVFIRKRSIRTRCERLAER